ncbi:MAG: tRNA preQ1(34) S-adenosylmethionine ribosyltransferase-isomerase QueA [Treponema sp.]|nr:tRNA preQ1(34) S-adenosylmethionine ribosyltransferase-isomerase QueA [Treponema sp.]
MKTKDFCFDLPENLIAQFPPKERGQSRLMTLDRTYGFIKHETVSKLPEILCEKIFLSPSGKKPLLVFNDTKVRKARLCAKNIKTGTETEFLLLEDKKNDGFLWKAMAKRASRIKIGSIFEVEQVKAEVIGHEDGYILLRFKNAVTDEWLENYGHVPLPPYIKRKDERADSERYQTIYAKETGSAAAPTAGLHFTKETIESLKKNGIDSAFVTLHVGLGTFLPVRSENIQDHTMHSETYCINDSTAVKIENAKNEGRKIIAVGTTSVRTLESAWEDGKLKKGKSNTSIFIYPGYKFNVIDALFTNFHTPESTLLMLVSAFAGKEVIMQSYAEAIKEQYRFFSYGDAMLIY